MPITREKPRLLICEDETDKAFFEQLMLTEGINNIQVHFAGGRGQFNQALKAARTAAFKDILLVSDSDDNPGISFSEVCDGIRSAQYTVPARPRVIAPASGKNPSVTVLMVPWDDEEGSVETVCLPALEGKFPQETECLNQFCVCTHTDTWRIKARSEMRVECLLACTYATEPKISLRYVLQRSNCPIDLNHECFTRIRDAIRSFSSSSV